MAPEERLQDDVVERERERRAEDDQRALRALERELLPGPERNDDGHPEQRDHEAQNAPREQALETEHDCEHERHPGCEGDDEGSDAGRGVLRPQVQEEVVADDDDQSCDDDPYRISARETGKAAGTPEDEREPGRRERHSGEERCRRPQVRGRAGA